MMDLGSERPRLDAMQLADYNGGAMSDLEKAIEEFFLADGTWELEVTEETPTVLGGRWLWNSDSNYGFRPVDLIKAIADKT